MFCQNHSRSEGENPKLTAKFVANEAKISKMNSYYIIYSKLSI